MASKFLSSLKDRRKTNKKANKDGSDDELAIVKAAAWAWYQHGSGSEGKAMSEFDVTRTQRTPKPSRYKLEAMRMANDEEEGEDHDEGSSSSKPSSQIHQRKNSVLLDAYEVQSISRQIGISIIESNNNSNNNNNNNKIVSGKDNTSSLESGRRMVKNKDKKKNKKGFWLRQVAVCGRGEDVVDPTSASSSLRDHHRKSSAKHVPVK